MQTLIFSHPQCSFFQWPGCHAPPRTQWTGIQCAHSSHHRQWAVLKLFIRMRMILSETQTTSNTFSHHSSARRTPNSISALVISRPKKFEARVFSNYLLNAFHFQTGLLETTQVHSASRHCLHHFTCFLLHRAHIKCANTKRFWAFAGFATRARPCSSTPMSCQAGDATDYSMVAGTT